MNGLKTSSMNCRSRRTPFQSLDSLNASTSFSEKHSSSLISASSHSLPIKLGSWQYEWAWHRFQPDSGTVAGRGPLPRSPTVIAEDGPVGRLANSNHTCQTTPEFRQIKEGLVNRKAAGQRLEQAAARLRQAQRSVMLAQKGLSEEPKSLKNTAKLNEACLKYVWPLKSCDFKGTTGILTVGGQSLVELLLSLPDPFFPAPTTRSDGGEYGEKKKQRGKKQPKLPQRSVLTESRFEAVVKTVSEMDPDADDSCNEPLQLWLTAEQARCWGGQGSLPERRGPWCQIQCHADTTVNLQSKGGDSPQRGFF